MDSRFLVIVDGISVIYRSGRLMPHVGVGDRILGLTGEDAVATILAAGAAANPGTLIELQRAE